MNYKIWDYVIEASPLDAQLPDGVNFNTQLTIKTHKQDTIVTGELRQRVHYADATMDAQGVVNYSIPLVRETWTYYRDVTGLAYMRDHQIAWYWSDGTLDEDNVKSSSKFYASVAAKREEFVRRRANCISHLVDKVLYMLVVNAGMSAADAQVAGTAFFTTIADKQATYREGDGKPLRDAITVATDAWLDADVSGVSIRQTILNDLV